jgi:FeS assembly SUF system regulator
MLKMTKLADYGTVVMTAMAHDPRAVHSAAGLATRLNLAGPTVSKILKTLAREGLVVSVRGAKGGYRLSDDPAEISLARIIRAMDGPFGMTECSMTPGLCSQESYCTVRANWQRVNDIVLQALQAITLQQMTQPVPRTVSVEAIKRRHARTPA